MNARQLGVVASYVRTIAAAVALVFVGRFAFVSISAAMAKSSGTPPGASSSAAPRGADRTPRVDSSSIPTSMTAASSPVTMGTALRMTAMITLGPDRSEVFIDDTDVGKTPYLGDVSCHAGDKVHVRIVPLQGTPLEVDRPCKPGTLRVEP